MREARAGRARGEIVAADGLFRQALALWRGEALAGMCGGVGPDRGHPSDGGTSHRSGGSRRSADGGG
ncbi:hypothetical protein [Nonomuraea rubra]|uniref:hypothetical protein n=1 Tax=Nonomuraea rubra TaxID=46180 RepID=UPI003CD0A6E9